MRQFPQQRLKVLVSAYACHPEMGSEPGMGWHWIQHMAKYHDLWVLTEDNRYAPVVTDAIARCDELRGRIKIFGIPRVRFGEKLWSHLYYASYWLWQWKAYRTAVELHRTVGFDLAHQLNMIGYREPGFLWKLPIPFVWGPVGGHAQMPWRYLSILEGRDALHYGLRNLLNLVQMWGSVRVRRAVRKASVIVAATEEDRRAIRRIHGREPVPINEVGTSPVGIPSVPEPWDGKRPLRLVWCGLLLGRKGLPLVLHALSRLSAVGRVELHVVGSGPSEGSWKSLAVRLGVDSCCHWHGWLPHDQALESVRVSDALMFSSIQEATSTVVLEALQSGVPIICHDTCGFGTVVTESCGIKFPVATPSKSIEYFADAIGRLLDDPGLLSRLREGALARSKELSWENKAREMSQLYFKALNGGDFRSPTQLASEVR